MAPPPEMESKPGREKSALLASLAPVVVLVRTTTPGSRILLALALACATGGSVLAIAQAYFTARMLDATIAGDLPALLRAVLGAVAVHAGIIGLEALQALAQGAFTQRTLAALRRSAASRLAHAKAAAIGREHSGQTLSRLTNDLGMVEDLLGSTLPQTLSGLLTAVLAVAYMFVRNWLLALVAVLGTPLILQAVSRTARPIAALSKEAQEALARVNVVLEESLRGAEVVKAFSLGKRLRDAFSVHDRIWLDKSERRNVRSAFLSAVGLGVAFMPFLLVFGFGSLLVLRKATTLGTVFSFVSLLNYVSFPMQRVPQLTGQIVSDAAAATRVLDVLSLPAERQDGQALLFAEGAPAVEFENVSFAYPGTHEPVLSNLSFSVAAHERVALAGRSGSGKTTVLRLILGDYQPDRGVIRVGGHDVRHWHLPALRSHICVVDQDTYLFPYSVRDNIALGRPGATAQEIARAADLSRTTSFAQGLPAGFETPVGELGSRLSGGEKQRISLARALLRNADVMLLDEATSALDYHLEREVVQGIRETFRGTSITVAHRLSTLRDADRIIVLEGGRLVEQGSHADLMARMGRYFDLYSAQVSEGGETR